MLMTLLAALAVGSLAYVIVKIALMTFSWLKARIVEKLKKNPPGITEEAVIHIGEILKQAPEVSLSDFGPDMQADDFLMVGINSDGSLDENMDVIRAKQVDDDVKATMKKAGGAIKIAN